MADWSGPGFNESPLRLLASGNAVTINSGGATLNLAGIDMRGFYGYYLYQEAINVGAAAYCPVRANLRWSAFDEFDANNTSQFTFRRDYDWWASTGSPGANSEAMTSGIDEEQDRCYGGSVALSWSNFGTSNITLTYYFYGTTRPIDRDFKAASPWDDMMYENAAVALPAGNLYYTIPLPRFWGRTLTHVEATAVAQLTYQWGSAAGLYLINGAGSTSLNQELIFPNRAALLRLNRPAGAGTGVVFVTTERRKH